MSCFAGPDIVDNGLVLSLDAGNFKSYVGIGTTWIDLTSRGNNATLINMDNTNLSSSNGGSFSFNGTDEYVSETSALSDAFWQGNWTASFWVNFDVLSVLNTGSDDRPLLHHGSSQVRQGLHLTQRNTRIHFGLFGNDIQGVGILTTGNWYNIAFTLNNSTFRKEIYLNGSLDNFNIGLSYIGIGTNTRIGGRALTFGLFFDGFMSSCSFYNRVLTPQEIRQNFNATKSRYSL